MGWCQAQLTLVAELIASLNLRRTHHPWGSKATLCWPDGGPSAVFGRVGFGGRLAASWCQGLATFVIVHDFTRTGQSERTASSTMPERDEGAAWSEGEGNSGLGLVNGPWDTWVTETVRELDEGIRILCL